MSRGKVAGLLVRLTSRGPTRRMEEVRVDPGRGLEDDHARGGRREVTLMTEEGWRQAAEACGRPDLEWDHRRANILLAGVELDAKPGRRLRLGDCLLELGGPNPPCGLMDDVAPGLQEALEPDLRAGVVARVLEGGSLRLGDEAAYEDS